MSITTNSDTTARSSGRRPGSARAAAIVFALGGLLVFVAGQIHPKGDLDEDFHAMEGTLLSHADEWDSTHAVLAVAIVVLTIGFALLLRVPRVRDDSVLRVAAVVALVGLLVSWAEMAFHIAMTSEAHALLTGGATPLFDAHVVLQAVYTPLFGWGAAVLAWRAGATRRWGNPWIAVLGVVGGVVFGLSGPVVALWPNSHDSLLFIGDAPLGLWALLCGTQVLWREARQGSRAEAAG